MKLNLKYFEDRKIYNKQYYLIKHKFKHCKRQQRNQEVNNPRKIYHRQYYIQTKRYNYFNRIKRNQDFLNFLQYYDLYTIAT
jgi:hypothetical protein